MDDVSRDLARYDLALIADGLDACGRTDQVVSAEIRSLTCPPRPIVVGRARTVAYRVLPAADRFRPVDAVKKAAYLRRLEALVEPGDVLVMSTAGEVPECGVLGGLFGAMYKNCGASALVVNGYVRDRDELEALGLPVHARGTTPRNGTGRVTSDGMGQPIDIAGVAITHGDYIALSADGAVVVPADPALLSRLTAWLADTGERERATAELVSGGVPLSDAFQRFARV